VGGVIVADHMQLDPGIGLGDLPKEGEELDVRVLLEASVGEEPCRDLVGREEGRGPIEFVVVRVLSPGSPAAAAGSVRSGRSLGSGSSTPQAGGTPSRCRRRPPGLAGPAPTTARPAPCGQVETDDVADLGLELRVGGELERLGLSRLQAPPSPDPAKVSEVVRQRRADQCVNPRFSGGGSIVAAMMTCPSYTGGRPDRGRSWSCSSPPAV